LKFNLPGLRGQSPNVIILEEAAHLKEKVFFEAVAPLMGNDKVVTLAISTPENKRGNYYNMLLDLTKSANSSEPLFYVIDLQNACEQCKQSGEAANCTHVQQVQPPWRTTARREMLDHIYSGKRDLYAQENRGVRMDQTLYVFDRKLIAYLKAKPRHVVPNRRIDLVFTAIDPAGGGTQSDYAVVSTTFHTGEYVVRSSHQNTIGFRTLGDKVSKVYVESVLVVLVEHETRANPSQETTQSSVQKTSKSR